MHFFNYLTILLATQSISSLKHLQTQYPTTVKLYQCDLTDINDLNVFIDSIDDKIDLIVSIFRFFLFKTLTAPRLCWYLCT